MSTGEKRNEASGGGWLRLWILLLGSYVCVKLAYDQLVLGYLDLRPSSLVQLLLLPTAQAGALLFVTRRARQSRGRPR
jgi:hypothetical protein